MIHRFFLLLVFLLGLTAVACSAPPAAEEGGASAAAAGDGALPPLALPALDAVALAGRPLRVVATTSIIGEVVGRVGGGSIELTTLMAAGQDPHSYQPGARELTVVADADVVFVNGWDLEESLVGDLTNIGAGVPVVPISAGIAPLARGADLHDDAADAAPGTDADDHSRVADPHVWLDVDNVIYWVDNVVQILTALDPANGAAYAANGAAYRQELTALQANVDALLAGLPQERRVLVTNHDALAYFAAAYGFEVLGTVVAGSSTLAEPSAQDLSGLIETMRARGVCALFTETTASSALADTVAAELGGCSEVKVVALYTGALGPAGSGADTYAGMLLANVTAIVEALR